MCSCAATAVFGAEDPARCHAPQVAREAARGARGRCRSGRCQGRRFCRGAWRQWWTSAHAASPAEDYVYLDYAATAPLCEEAAQRYGALHGARAVPTWPWAATPTRLHIPGRAAFAALEDARRAHRPHALGATASRRDRPHLAAPPRPTTRPSSAWLQAAADARDASGGDGPAPCRTWWSRAIEHDAVLAPVPSASSAMGFSVTRRAPDRQGFIAGRRACARSCAADTVLVSRAWRRTPRWVRIQPVAELAPHGPRAPARSSTPTPRRRLARCPSTWPSLALRRGILLRSQGGRPEGRRRAVPEGPHPLRRISARAAARRRVVAAARRTSAAPRVSPPPCQAAQEKPGRRSPARLRALRDRLYAALARNARRPAHGGGSARQRRTTCPTSCTCWSMRWKARRSSCASTMRGFGVSGGSACSSPFA